MKKTFWATAAIVSISVAILSADSNILLSAISVFAFLYSVQKCGVVNYIEELSNED